MKSTPGRTIDEVIAEHDATDPAFHKASSKTASFIAIANEVLLARTQLGMTQDDLAKQLGTTKSAISRIESGRQPTTVATLQGLSNALNTQFVIAPQGFSGNGADDAETQWQRVVVAPDPAEGSWVVRGSLMEGLATERTQAAAVQRAHEELRTNGGGELEIHRRDGSLREVRRIESA